MVTTRTTVWVSQQTLTAAALNAEFNNLLNAPSIVNADIASGAAIAVSKISTGLSGSLVGTTDTQTLTNKTLTLPIISGLYDNGNSGSSITINWANGGHQKLTLTASTTLSYSNAVSGQILYLELIQDAGGSRTVTYPSGTKWPGGVIQLVTTTASAINLLGVMYDGSSYLTQLAINFS